MNKIWKLALIVGTLGIGVMVAGIDIGYAINNNVNVKHYNLDEINIIKYITNFITN